MTVRQSKHYLLETIWAAISPVARHVIAAIVDGRGAPEAVVGVLGGASRVGLLLVLEREHAGEAGLLSSASCADWEKE
jgi:hypothetical protein